MSRTGARVWCLHALPGLASASLGRLRLAEQQAIEVVRMPPGMSRGSSMLIAEH